jgi:hypothetical protein
VEILRLDVSKVDLEDFAELEPAEYTTEVHLSWGSGPSIEEVLPILRRWRHLRRLTLSRWYDRSVPPFEVLGDFIMSMKHLTYLHLVPNNDRSNCGQLESLRDKINDLVLLRRPNFKIDIGF